MEEALEVGVSHREDRGLEGGLGISGQGSRKGKKKAFRSWGFPGWQAGPNGGDRAQCPLKGLLRGEMAGLHMVWEGKGRVRCPWSSECAWLRGCSLTEDMELMGRSRPCFDCRKFEWNPEPQDTGRESE